MPLAIEQDKNTASSKHRNLDRRGVVLGGTSRRLRRDGTDHDSELREPELMRTEPYRS